MKIFIAVLAAVLAATSAAFISSSYIPPVADNSLVTQEYIPPENVEEPVSLAEDGYRYKVVRKLKLRLRRDVNELPAGEYLPAVQADQRLTVEEQSPAVLETIPEEKTLLTEDGYRYKTVRRLKYRQRRDVNELPVNEYLPPTEVEQPVAEEIVVNSVPEIATDLADDGYRYKTVRRLKYRQRRDVNELPVNEYLPPTEVVQPVAEEIVVNSVPEIATDLADDGYRYKTVRRLKYRQRRDVNELPVNEYLPPTEVVQPVAEEIVVNSVPEIATDLADDGYRYKTVRRLKYRQRRDVNELPVNEYLPPTEVVQPVAEEIVVNSVPEIATDLADDGYRYKTVRRLKYRQRRDVNELPGYEYLPPTAVEEPITQIVSVVESNPEVKTDLAEDGYRYKIVRRLKYRQRRDVSELPANEYLPSIQPEEFRVFDASPEVNTALSEDGYRYKTVHKLKYKRH